ncbi:hypothetical protein [Agarilytica rhodophyticola]|uniref:hypothetical protein n=1 Tax=Agarilytica rhodophyticola TaxID=1737490 RepID=UPI000B34470E|nr:hypothetical protein [Agarilytica rhodophyticola]
MKNLFISIFFSLVFITTSTSAAQLNNLAFQNSTIPTPLSGFSVEYDIFGTSPLAELSVSFFLSGDSNPNTGIPLATRRVAFRCGGQPGSPCQPPVGRQSEFFSGFAIQEQARTLLETLQNSCSTTPLYVVARLQGDNARASNSPTVVGTLKLPDFLFDSGTITPSVIPTDGSVTITYSVRSICPSPILPGVSVYLADSEFNPLVLFGTVGVLGPFGSNHSIILSVNGLNLEPGSYNIVLYADVNQRVQESNENNNIGAFSVDVIAALQEGLANKPNPELIMARPPVNFIDNTPNIDYIPNFESVYFSDENKIKVYEGSPNKPLENNFLDKNKIINAFELKISE